MVVVEHTTQVLKIVINGRQSSERHHAFPTIKVPDEENVLLRILCSGQHAVSESGFRHKIGDHGVPFVRRDSEIFNKKKIQTWPLFYRNLTVFRGFIVEVCSLGNASHVQFEIPIVTFFTDEAFISSGIPPGEDESADIKR